MTAALNHVQKVPDPPSTRTELSIPPDLEQLILRCLEKDPNARPSSACDLIGQLDACTVPGTWSAGDATRWWDHHLPPSSSLRSFAQSMPATPTPVQRAS